jgi:hypothetical protein
MAEISKKISRVGDGSMKDESRLRGHLGEIDGK